MIRLGTIAPKSAQYLLVQHAAELNGPIDIQVMGVAEEVIGKPVAIVNEATTVGAA